MVVRLSLNSIVTAEIVLCPVSVILPIGFVMLSVIGYQVMEGKTVVTGYKINTVEG